MRRFLKYPIYVNHPGRYEEARRRQIEYFAAKKDLHMYRWLQHTAKNLYETIEDPNPPPEAVSYEKSVIEILKVIVQTPIGRLLFGALNPNIRYSIHPYLKSDGSKCHCGAMTFPGAPKEGGGIRVYYNPTEHENPSDRFNGQDDILFHEMVHAYRMGRWTYEIVNGAKDMTRWGDSEEFVATQMQNVYLSQRGGNLFYRNYPLLQGADKTTAYDDLIGDRQALGQLNYMVNTDSVVETVAGYSISFNAFRDRLKLGEKGGMP